MYNLISFHQYRRLLSGTLTQRLQRYISSGTSFKFADLQLQLCSDAEKRTKPDPDKLVFGREFTDHMLEIEWTRADGWGVPTISPFHNLSLHPAAKVLHYATELFEGMKAFRCVDDKVRMFRPDQNIQRLLTTAERSALPTFDAGEFLNCLRKLVSVEKEWVPYSTSSSLYIRPTMIGSEGSLGVSPPGRALLFVIMSPVGPYFPDTDAGMVPVSLMAEPKYVRAFEGGCGSFKMGANYAPTINIQLEAMEKYGCQQVLWLYGPDHLLTEVGTMNIFMYWINPQGEKELITPPTPPLGIILPGITRKSLIDLAKEKGEFKITERFFGMEELIQGLKEGRVKEMFGSGTACVVCPIKEIVYQGERHQIPTMEEGAPVTTMFYKQLTDIQYGRTPSPSDWMVAVD